MRYLTSVQRRRLDEQTIKADILRDWIEKIREAFDRTVFYKNFVEGLAAEALEQYVTEHPEDKGRVDGIRDPIKNLIAQSQTINKMLVDLDQKIGRSQAAIEASPAAAAAAAAAVAPAETPAEEPIETPPAEVPVEEPAEEPEEEPEEEKPKKK